MPPDEELLDSAFQPPDGNILHRNRFAPPNARPGATFPTVLMLPPDVFNAQYGDHGVASERWATRDIQYSGFLVFQIDHRLAPGHGGLPGQTSSGYPPDQTDDVKRQILAALADPSCNGKIYLVGGSAGGCLALWCALDSSSGNVSAWNNTARLAIKAVVSLSGVTALDNWNNPGNLSTLELAHFTDSLDNYVNLPDGDHTHQPLIDASPITLVSTATSSPPVLFFATKKDPVPYEQQDVMFTALVTKFGNPSGKFTKYLIDDSTGLHAFNYWHTQNVQGSTSDCVSHQVITFLQTYL